MHSHSHLYISLFPAITLLLFSILFLSFWLKNKHHPCLIWFSLSLFLTSAAIVIEFLIKTTDSRIELIVVFIIHTFSNALLMQSLLVRFRTNTSFIKIALFSIVTGLFTSLMILQEYDISSIVIASSCGSIAMNAYTIAKLSSHKTAHVFDRILKASVPLMLAVTVVKIIYLLNISVQVDVHYPLMVTALKLSVISMIIIACCMQDGINSMALLSMTDPMTGALNRRHLIDIERDLSIKSLGGGTICMCDIDNFKSINDNYGHDIGDKSIKIFCNTMKKALRRQDLLFRVGGEEFLILLYPVNIEQSVEIIEEIRLNLKADATAPSFTASFGIAEIDEEKGLTASIKVADNLLYRAKRNGKDRIETSAL